MNSPKARQRYTREFKDDAVDLVIKHGYSCAEAGRRLGINANNIIRWVGQYRDQQEAAESSTASPMATMRSPGKSSLAFAPICISAGQV